MVMKYKNTERVPETVSSFGPRLEMLGFKNFYAHQSFSNIERDSVYVYCTLSDSVFRDIITQEHSEFEIDTIQFQDFSMPQRDYRSGVYDSDYVFKLPLGTIVGTYSTKHNVVIIPYDITHEYNKVTTSILEYIVSTLESLSTDNIQINLEPKKETYLTVGNKIYTLKCISDTGNLFNEYVERVNANFKKAISRYKEQYIQKLDDEKKKYNRYRKEHVPMPEITYSDIINHKVMISKNGIALTYNFIVSFKVTEAIDEIARKRILLSEPILFNDMILSMVLDEKDKLVSVRLADKDGTGTSRHLHTSIGTVCTGTTEVIGKSAKTLSEVVQLKNRVLEALTRYNVVDAVQRNDFRNSLYKQLEEAPSESWTQRVWHV